MVLGDYELREIIGRGGMGTVYRAWQRSLQREVAIKVLAEHIAASPKSVQRFEREARAAAKLHHTHIIPIFARGEDGGKYYYAMELVEGRGLNAIIAEERNTKFGNTSAPELAETVPIATRSGPSLENVADSSGVKPGEEDSSVTATLHPSQSAIESRQRIVNIVRHMANVADGLGYAHAHGVVHRDIKPHNLILGIDGRMRIADFGLARVVEAPGVTMTGEVVGSPLYMAPEFLDGSETVDHRADVYSLGATMYEWLCLAPPHPGETRESVISHILQHEPLSVRTHDPAIPIDLETICAKAMHREPSRRYTSAVDLGDDLRRFLDNRNIKATRAGLLERSVRAIKRHPVAAVGCAAIVVIAAMGIALFRKDTEVRQTAEQLERLQSDALNALTDEQRQDLALRILDPFAGAGKSFLERVVEGGTQVVQSSVLGQDSKGPNPDAARKAEGIAVRAARDLFNAIGAARIPLMNADEFSGYYDQAVDLSANRPQDALDSIRLFLTAHEQDVHALQLRASLQARLKRYDDMAAGAEDIIRVRGQSHAGFLWRGLARFFLGQVQLALRDLERAAESDRLAPWAHTLRGIVLLQREMYTDAVMALDDALAVAPDVVVGLLARAEAHSQLGNYRSAVGDITHVIRQEPNNANALVCRGDHYRSLGDLPAALSDYEKSAEIAGENQALIARRVSTILQMNVSPTPPRSPSATPDSATLQVPRIPESDQQGSATDVRLAPPRAHTFRSLRSFPAAGACFQYLVGRF